MGQSAVVFLVILLYLGLAALGLWLTFLVIRAAILSALAEDRRRLGALGNERPLAWTPAAPSVPVVSRERNADWERPEWEKEQAAKRAQRLADEEQRRLGKRAQLATIPADESRDP